MSDYKIKVNLELDNNLKEKIDEYVKESVLKAIQNIDKLSLNSTSLKGEK